MTGYKVTSEWLEMSWQHRVFRAHGQSWSPTD